MMYKELLEDIKETLDTEFQSVLVKIGALNWAKNAVYPLIEILPGKAERAVYVGSGGVGKEKLIFTIIYANRGTFAQAEELEKSNADAAEQIVAVFKNKNSTIDQKRVLFQVPGYALERILVESTNHYVVGAAIELQIETVR